MTQHHEGTIARHGGVSLATRAYALYRAAGLTIPEVTIRLFGEDTVHGRRKVNSLIDEARRNAARSH